LSDEEIVDLYREAATAERSGLGGVLRERGTNLPNSAYREAAAADTIIAALVAWLVAFGFTSWDRHPFTAAAIALVAVAIIAFSLSYRMPVGVFSLWLHRHPPRHDHGATIDPHDPQVLAAVVDHVTCGPIEHAERIIASVRLSRTSIAEALGSLPGLVEALSQEIETSIDATMTLLLEGKRHAAQRAIERLQEQNVVLSRQAEEAERAVAPVRHLAEKFDRIRQLSESLVSIRAAHGLIEETESTIEDHRMEIQVLRATSMKALAQLREIEDVLQASQSARNELAIE
jgi:hypothetical protein